MVQLCKNSKSLNTFSMYTFDLDIPFESARHADIVLNSIVQDEEPRSGSMIERYLVYLFWLKSLFLYFKICFFSNGSKFKENECREERIKIELDGTRGTYPANISK